MYPIDVQQLIRRGTLGSRALDPTLPHRPSRLRRLTAALTHSRRASEQRACLRTQPAPHPWLVSDTAGGASNWCQTPPGSVAWLAASGAVS